MFKKPFRSSAIALLSLGILAGCVTPVENLKPTNFDAGNLNQSSSGRVVTILHLMPAKAQVSNAENHRRSETVGTISGAAICGVAAGVAAGIFAGEGAGVGAGIGGALLCGYLGHYLGAIIEPPELHPDSLIIVYQDPNNPQIQQTIEIAKPCEFKPGTGYAVIINNPKTHKVETRIQPNNFQACLSKKKQMEQEKIMLKAAKKAIHAKHQDGAQTTEAEDAYKRGIVTPSYLTSDGTVILNGTYLGKMATPDDPALEALKGYGASAIGNDQPKLKIEGLVNTLDNRRTVQILPDGRVLDITNLKDQRQIGSVPVEELKEFSACSQGSAACKIGTF
ncbi:hypothetical protein FAI41_03225 [Acetobacteraceae bacterium]|nr:hypothetical protein FAI41_03225 [Acetobacteraceae bacterium]